MSKEYSTLQVPTELYRAWTRFARSRGFSTAGATRLAILFFAGSGCDEYVHLFNENKLDVKEIERKFIEAHHA